jgi:hypothetical protein
MSYSDVFCNSSPIVFYIRQTLMTSIVCYRLWHAFQSHRPECLGLMSSENKRN